MSLSKFRVAVFLHGCFWHRHVAHHSPLPKSNRDYWAKKFRRNHVRDRRKIQDLRRLGWHPVIVWECQLRKGPDRVLARVVRAIGHGGVTASAGTNRPKSSG